MVKRWHWSAAGIRRCGGAVLAGVTLALAFPKFSVEGFAWLGPALFLVATFACRPGSGFRIAFLGALVHYLISLYWLLYMPVPIAPIGAWLALSAYLAVYPALWVWLCWRMYPARFVPGETWRENLAQFFKVSWRRRQLWIVLCACSWVGWEIWVGRFLTGFPWNFLGASQYKILPLIQISSITGVYGVSFCIVYFSVGLLCTSLGLVYQPGVRWAWQREIIIPFLFVATVAGIGWRTLGQSREPGPTVKTVLIQPSVPQTMKWDPKEADTQIKQLLALSEVALTNGPTLMIWPEAAVPLMFRYFDEFKSEVTKLLGAQNTWLVLGSDDMLREQNRGRWETNYYNASFALSPRGEISGEYRKRRLVIFGEYVPLRSWFPIIQYLTPITGSFTPGKEATPFDLKPLGIKLAVLICFEDVFPHLTREYVQEDTDFLVNLTNNGWFGESAAQWQHAANAVFRAVENRTPLVRCANNGLTCWVDEQGRLHETYFPGTDNIYQAGYKLAEVPTLAGNRRQLTIYTRYGDVFGWSCFVLTVGMLSASIVQARREKRLGPA